MADAGLLNLALETLKRESSLKPVCERTSFEQALINAERDRASYMRQIARKGGKRKDDLQKLIETIVTKTPDIDRNRLLHALRAKKGNGIVYDVTDSLITYENSHGKMKDVKISALKHRLTKARKEMVAKSR